MLVYFTKLCLNHIETKSKGRFKWDFPFCNPVMSSACEPVVSFSWLHAWYPTTSNFFSDRRELTLVAIFLPFISRSLGWLWAILFNHIFKHSVLSSVRGDRFSSSIGFRSFPNYQVSFSLLQLKFWNHPLSWLFPIGLETFLWDKLRLQKLCLNQIFSTHGVSVASLDSICTIEGLYLVIVRSVCICT